MMNLDTERREEIHAVMVVDDDENWCFLSKKMLQRAGFQNQIITATNGLKAINLLREMAAKGEGLPDFIFLDIKMPVMDGFEFLEEIKKAPELDLSRTKIFICSSSILPRDKERARQYAAVSGFLTKPLTKDALRDILQ